MVARRDSEEIRPGDLVMLEELGGCLVLAVHDGEGEGTEPALAPDERTTVLDVETLAHDNTAQDIP